MRNDSDAQFLCMDCERYNSCNYYDGRKMDAYICKYFHLPEWENNQMTPDERMDMILKECSKHPEVYNKVSNWLYKKLDIHSAEMSLIITYFMLTEWRSFTNENDN